MGYASLTMGKIKHRFCQDPILYSTYFVLLLGIIVRFAVTFFVEPSGDSFSHLNAARFIAENMKLPLFEPVYRPFFYYPPLFHILAASLYTLFSFFGQDASMKAMNFTAPLFGSASLILFYFFARLFAPRTVVLYSTIFLAFIPIHMYYSTLAHTDIAAMFMTLVILYLLYSGRFYASAIASGFGLLTKYTVMFCFTAVIYRIYETSKSFSAWTKRVIAYFGIVLLIGSPLYLRNLILLQNPMWPFLNNIAVKFGLNPLLMETRPAPDLTHLSELLIAPIRAYLDLFGVPLGIPEHLLRLPLPLMVLWILATLLFIVPLVMGLFAKKPPQLCRLMWLLIGTYALMFVYYIYDFGSPFFRLLLPIFCVLPLLWGYGLDLILSRVSKKTSRYLIFGIIALICSGFVFVEFTKPLIASSQNRIILQDYEWINAHIPIEGSYFDWHHPALIFYTQHHVVSMLKTPEDYEGTIYHYYSPHLKEKYHDLAQYNDWDLIYNNPESGGKIFRKP